MNYLIPTIGTRGDVQPYIALASSLQNAGQRAVIATHPCMRDLVESHGVSFAPIGPDIDIGHQADRPNMAEALQQVLENRALQAKASELGRLIRAETGVQNAVHLIGQAR